MLLSERANSCRLPLLGSSRTITPSLVKANHSAPSNPAAMDSGNLPIEVAMGNSLSLLSKRDRRPMLPKSSVNHSSPSGPGVIAKGVELAVATVTSLVTTPEVVIRPILLAFCSVNHNAPSAPAVMPKGLLLAVGTENSVITPAVVIRPILLVTGSVNHSAPSGPTVMSSTMLFAVGIANSVIVCAGDGRPPSSASSSIAMAIAARRRATLTISPPDVDCRCDQPIGSPSGAQSELLRRDGSGCRAAHHAAGIDELQEGAVVRGIGGDRAVRPQEHRPGLVLILVDGRGHRRRWR